MVLIPKESASISNNEPSVVMGPHGHAKQSSQKNRVKVRKARIERRETLQLKKQYNRRIKSYGNANTGTFRKSIPGWWDSHLLKYRGMILSEPALNAYYEACERAGHYIGGSGYRSHSTQAGMTNPLAAPPGYSYHEIGLALDVFGLSSKEEHALLSVGFNPLAGDPGHYSYKVHG